MVRKSILQYPIIRISNHKEDHKGCQYNYDVVFIITFQSWHIGESGITEGNTWTLSVGPVCKGLSRIYMKCIKAVVLCIKATKRISAANCWLHHNRQLPHDNMCVNINPCDPTHLLLLIAQKMVLDSTTTEYTVESVT